MREIKGVKLGELVNKCRKYIPLDGRILVYTLKLKQVRQKDYSFAADKDSKLNQGKDPGKHRVDIKKVYPMVNCKYQQATVLQIPLDETRFKVGDTIIYPIGVINEFDQVKGVSIIRKYDIVAVINDHLSDEFSDIDYSQFHVTDAPILAGFETYEK